MSKRSFPTIAEALRLIEHDEALTEGSRERMKTGLNALAKLSQPALPEMVLLDPQHSLALMERSSPAAFGVKAKTTVANYRAALRAALRHLGFLSALPKVATIADPAWLVLLALLPEGHDFDRLRAFVSWLAAEGVPPAAVEQAHLDAYVEQRQATRGGGKQVDHVRRVLGLWRRAAKDFEGWPVAGLANPKAKQLSLPFDAYPAPLKEEVEQYLKDIATEVDPFADDEEVDDGSQQSQPKKLPNNPVSAATVKTRSHGVRKLLWGAQQEGVSMDSLNSLRVLLAPKVFKPSFRWHMRHKGIRDKKLDVQLTTFVGTIFSVANYYDVAPGEKAQLKAFFKKLQPKEKPDGLIDRHERILDALEDLRVQAMFLHLPQRLMKEARKLRDGWTEKKNGKVHAPRPMEGVWLAGLATAIEIELHAPLRLTDLARLRIGDHLRLGGSTGSRAVGTLHVEESSKTSRGIQVPLQPDSINLIREYLDDFRPMFRHASSAWLFPSEKSMDRPRDVAAFGTAITESIAQFVGLRVNPHAFRCIAGAFILKEDPNALDDVRALLGHATFNTALRYYRRINTREAATRLGLAIARKRRSSMVLANGPVAKSRRRPGDKTLKGVV